MFTNRPARSTGPVRTATQADVEVAQGDSGNAIMADSYHIRDRVQRKLLAEVDGDVDITHQPQMRQIIESLFNQVLVEENLLYTRAVRTRLLDWVVADIMGYGPLEPLLSDPTITSQNYQNVLAYLAGFEASARYALPWNLYLSGALAFTYGQQSSPGGHPLQEVPPLCSAQRSAS